MLAKAVTVRKVRASQGRITDNVRRGRPPGKCNRNKPPRLFRIVQKAGVSCRRTYEGTSRLILATYESFISDSAEGRNFTPPGVQGYVKAKIRDL